LRSLGKGSHARCFACGDAEGGLGLRFSPAGEDSVVADWWCEGKYQGYDGLLHGGLAATLLDAAMTNCLLRKGLPAVTADLHVRYHTPVRVDHTAQVRATLKRSRAPLYALEAEIVQGGQVRASASAKFMRAEK
jgi:uncharacterized protein (TIGR00369 family)